MEITNENKNEMKQQINDDINQILEKHELPYRMDGISVMKTSKGTSFLGNVRVHDPLLTQEMLFPAVNCHILTLHSI